MDKISCNVTRDLMASYLDGICSEESKTLVEEHMRECASCRKFVEQLRAQDLGKDGAKVDFLKKVRRSVYFRAGLGIACSVALLFIGNPRMHMHMSLVFYQIAMPLLMLACALVLATDGGNPLSNRKEWVVPALGAVLALAALILQIWVCCWFYGLAAAPCPDAELGPWIEWRNMLVAVLAVVLLAVSCIRLKGRSVIIVSQNLAWFSLSLSLSCDSLLYSLGEIPETAERIRNNIAILVLEFAVMTTLMLVLGRCDRILGKR